MFTAWVWRETFWCNVLWRTWTFDNNFSFFFLNLDKDLKNSTPGKIPCIWKIKQIQVDALRFERALFIIIFSDIFTAVIMAIGKDSYCLF